MTNGQYPERRVVRDPCIDCGRNDGIAIRYVDRQGEERIARLCIQCEGRRVRWTLTHQIVRDAGDDQQG